MDVNKGFNEVCYDKEKKKITRLKLPLENL